MKKLIRRVKPKKYLILYKPDVKIIQDSLVQRKINYMATDMISEEKKLVYINQIRKVEAKVNYYMRSKRRQPYRRNQSL